MKKYHLLLIAFVLAMAQGWATELKIEINPTQLHFATAVEQITAKTAQFTFGSGIIVIDDETTDYSIDNSNTSQTNASNISFHDFSVSIEGPDSHMFSANIAEVKLNKAFKLIVSVQISYLPMTEGPHQAVLKVMRNDENETIKSISHYCPIKNRKSSLK